MSFCKALLRCCVLPLCLLPVAAQTTTTQAPSGGAAAGGQIVSTGGTRLHGMVTDPDGAAIPGATVMLTPAKGNGIKTQSNGDGSYAITIAPGTYTVVISMPGFATYSMNGLKVPPVPSTTLDAKLKIGEQTTVVNVEANAISLSTDPDSNASATVISGKDLDALSDDPDELSSELSALAGPAAGPNGGQIYVDGFTGGQLPPKSSIREIRINQNPFSAEYDKLGFGRIEVFTKPGTDKFHGSLSFQGNDKSFNTSNPFLGTADQQPDYHTFFILGNLTGPLTKSSSFSIGGSRRTIQNNVIVNPTGFYSTSADSATLCPPGTVTGCANYGYPATSRAVFQPQTRSDITPRLDFALGAKNVLTTRYQYESGTTLSNGSSGNALASTFNNTSNDEHTIQISDTQTVSAKLVNEIRFEYQRDEATVGALSTAPSVSVQGSFSAGGAGTQSSDTISSHIELQNYTSYAVGKHFIRFGGRLRTTGESVTNISNPNGSFTYNYLLDPCTDPSITNKPSTCVSTTTPCANLTATGAAYISSYQCGTASQFRLTTTVRPNVNVRETDLGAYAEDDWKLRPNLTFSYGLRYEAENRVSDHDLAPRIALSYGVPRGANKPTTTVIRAGFGVFYDRIALGDFLTAEQLGTNPAQQQETVTNPGAACAPGNLTACNATSPSLTTVYTLAPNLRSEYIMQAALGVDQQIGKIGTVSVNYLPSRGNHAAYTNLTTSGNNYNYQYQSERVFSQQQLFVNGNIRAPKLMLFGFYALSFANSNTSGDSFIPTSSNPRVDYGRAAFATRNFGVIGGSYNAPYKFTLSPFILARSGTPYNVTTGTDVNGDSVYNDRPAFANGSAAACNSASSFVTPAQGSNYTEIPINYCTGPAVATVNLRLSRTFGFGPKLESARGSGNGGSGGPGGGMRGGPGGPGGRGGPGGGGPGGGPGGGFGGGGNSGRRYNITFGVQGQNIFNQVNYAAPTDTSALTSTQFGKLTQLVGRPFSTPNAVRVLTLQATFNF